jgi:NitT/TauT family transport system permease protein
MRNIMTTLFWLRLRQKIMPVLCLLMLLPLWELICWGFAIPDFVLPSPSAIGKAFVNVSAERWLGHLSATLSIAIAGFLLSLIISIPLAMLMVRFEFFSKTLYPLLIVIQSTPVIAIAPMLIVMFGAGFAPRLTITTLITFFPLVISATTGMRSTPPELIELSKSLKAPRYKEILQIRLPYAVPHIFNGMKIAITLSIIGAVVAEFVSAERGLGYFVQFSMSFFEIPQAFAALIFLSLTSLVLFRAISLLQSWLFAWSLPKT